MDASELARPQAEVDAPAPDTSATGDDELEFRRRVRRHSGRLSRADHRLLAALLERPTEAAFASAETTASWANVHAATAVRLAKKLGYGGYPQLRAAIQRDLVQHLEVVPDRDDDDSPGHASAALLKRQANALAQAAQQLNGTALRGAAQAIADARRVFVCDDTDSDRSLLAEWLIDAGFDVVPIGTAVSRRDRRLTLLGADDVLVAVILGDLSGDLPGLVATAQHREAATVVVGDARGALLRPTPDWLVVAPRAEAAGIRSVLVSLALCEALVHAVGQLAGASSTSPDAVAPAAPPSSGPPSSGPPSSGPPSAPPLDIAGAADLAGRADATGAIDPDVNAAEPDAADPERREWAGERRGDSEPFPGAGGRSSAVAHPEPWRPDVEGAGGEDPREGRSHRGGESTGNGSGAATSPRSVWERDRSSA